MYARRGHPLAVALILVLVCVILVAVLFLVPFPQDFAGSIQTEGFLDGPYSGTTNETFPSTSFVSLEWKSPSQFPMTFYVRPLIDPSGATMCLVENGITGSCSFHATLGSYELVATNSLSSHEVPELVTFSGTYARPLL